MQTTEYRIFRHRVWRLRIARFWIDTGYEQQKKYREYQRQWRRFPAGVTGRQKGQAWIEHNRTHITVPIISHLGAVINFVAGKLSRAPVWVQRTGLEWLWRIKEEPSLWRRYASDGLVLLKLLITRVVPMYGSGFGTNLQVRVGFCGYGIV